MLETAWTSIPEVDIVLFVVQPTSKGINEADKQILEKLKKIKKKVILVINKIDYVMKVRDRIKIAAQIEVLNDIAVEYNGKTIDNIIQQLEARLSVLKKV